MISHKKIYYIVLGLFTTAVLGSILNSFINYETVSLTFQKLGYPIYLIQLLGLFQIIGLSLIWFNKSHWSLEWAFAGFFINYSLGAISHLVIKDGNGASAVICVILLFVTYIQSKKIRESNNQIAQFEKPKYL